jgi:hypothetical protein
MRIREVQVWHELIMYDDETILMLDQLSMIPWKVLILNSQNIETNEQLLYIYIVVEGWITKEWEVLFC